MTNPNQTRRFGKEDGVAIVEAAVIMLGLFVLFLGIMESGRFINAQQVLTNAAREGARFAVAPLSGTDTLPSVLEVQDRVNIYLNSANLITGSTVLVEKNVAVNHVDFTTTYTRVTVTRPYQVLTIPMFSGLEIAMEGKATMRDETSS